MKARRCMRAGRVTNNGYLNFLREFRKKCCNFPTIVEMVKAGAKEWGKLSPQQKMRYRNINKRLRRPRRSNKTKRCMRAGPVTNNGYLNFLRKYRRNCCGMSPQETIKKGAKRWLHLSEKEKEKYERVARKLSKPRRRRTKVC